MEKIDAESPAIEVTGVSKSFKELIAVNDLTIKIEQGEFVALLGPNGAGKTTLVEMIEGLAAKRKLSACAGERPGSYEPCD